MSTGRLALIGAFALAGCAGTERGGGPAAEAQAPSPQQIVAARQSAFHLTGAAMGNIGASIARGGDPSGQAFAARGVARWAQALPGMFPASTAAITPSRAKPEIWANKADFEAKAADFAAAAGRMADAAQANDKAAFAEAAKATGATCGACHALYQAPAQPGR